jgi:predicted ATPase
MTLYNDDGILPDYHSESHGESFLTFITRCDPNGLYLMDEPEAALSPQRQLTLLIHLMSMAEKGAQFIIATHSPILLGLPGAQILSFDDGAIHPCSYEETDSYQVTALFINNREQLLGRLLEE